MKWELWSKSDQICGRFKSSAQIGRYSVWRFYVSATSATNVALVWHQKGGLTCSLDDLGIIYTWGAPQLPSLTNLNPQSSVLNPHCTTKCGTFMFVPHVPQMWYKCGTHLPQCLKVRHFWHRCLKCLKWGTKWGTKLDIFQKKFSLVFVRVIHLKVNLGQLMKIFIFLLGLSGGKG